MLRSPRFRLVFLMGFLFGLVICSMALAASTPRSFLGTNYSTVVSVYSLLLLSEVCFWNSSGFDRSAAQIYFLRSIPLFQGADPGKNLTAVFFIMVEISAITVVCGFLGNASRFEIVCPRLIPWLKAISIFLLGAGNLLSIYQARCRESRYFFPHRRCRTRPEVMLFVIYPIAFLPAGLAYLARWAFDSEAAFFAVLLIDATDLHFLALESAIAAAETLKERMPQPSRLAIPPISG